MRDNQIKTTLRTYLLPDFQYSVKTCDTAYLFDSQMHKNNCSWNEMR